MVIKKIGITGAAGVIGRTLVEHLGKMYDLVLFDKEECSNCTHGVITLDITKSKAKLVKEFKGLDALIHLAGNPNPNAPLKSIKENNFLGTSLTFEAAREAGVKKIVFASSNFYHQGDIQDALSGEGCVIFIHDNPTPLCAYGRSKVFGEQLGIHMSHMGISFTALRIGWTVTEDTPVPYNSDYMRAMFCSKRDLVQAFHKAIHTTDPFSVAFAISDNDDKVFDMTSSRTSIGYKPVDNSANYF